MPHLGTVCMESSQRQNTEHVRIILAYHMLYSGLELILKALGSWRISSKGLTLSFTEKKPEKNRSSDKERNVSGNLETVIGAQLLLCSLMGMSRMGRRMAGHSRTFNLLRPQRTSSFPESSTPVKGFPCEYCFLYLNPEINYR